MGLNSEWKAFGTFAVHYLGMPIEAMPLLNNKDCVKFNKKVKRINDFILEVGNMGHNRDLSYRIKYKGIVYKLVSFCRRLKDFVYLTKIFPLNSPKFFFTYIAGKCSKVILAGKG